MIEGKDSEETALGVENEVEGFAGALSNCSFLSSESLKVKAEGSLSDDVEGEFGDDLVDHDLSVLRVLLLGDLLPDVDQFEGFLNKHWNQVLEDLQATRSK